MLLPKYRLSFLKGPVLKRRKNASVGVRCRSFLEVLVNLDEKVNLLMN